MELEGGCEVKLLATGVWRPHSLVKEPRPVPRPRISPEKIKVFNQVTSMCSDLVAHLKNIPLNSLTNESHCVDSCHEKAIEEQSFSFHETEEVESSQGYTEDIGPIESDEIAQDVYQVVLAELAESMAREILDSILREVMLGDDNKREGTILEGDCPIESDEIDQDVYQDALAEPAKSMAREILDSLLKEVTLGNESKREGAILEGDCSKEELPEMTDDVSVSHENQQPFEKIEVEGELDEVLSSKFALIQLRRGGKALLRKRRLYIEGSLPG